MIEPLDRRRFLAGSMVVASLPAAACEMRVAPVPEKETPLFNISLAQWSLHRTLRAGELDAIDFPAYTKDQFGIEAVEYVNSFFKDKVEDTAWLDELKGRVRDVGMKSLLIMIDGEGALGAADPQERAAAIHRHGLWINAASRLGCHSIRVNAISGGSPDEQRQRLAEGLRELIVAHAEPRSINVIIENHGGLSSNGAWLASLMEAVDHPRCGTLPDFGNFRISDTESYDRYRGVRELMPWARAVSAKSHDFDAEGNDTATDYLRMMKIVIDAGYHGYVGVEYEGERLSERDGIRATKRLLERVRVQLAETEKSRSQNVKTSK